MNGPVQSANKAATMDQEPNMLLSRKTSSLLCDGQHKIRVLVCSANLGNARPDEASIAEWIPEDGRYEDVVHDNPKYPLPNSHEVNELRYELGLEQHQTVLYDPTTTASPDIEESESKSKSKGDHHFDIIVIGMQEATFDVDDEDAILPGLKPFLKPFGHGKAVVEGIVKDKDHTKGDVLGFLASKDSKVLQGLFQKRCPSYNFVVRYQRGEMRLEILAHSSLKVETLRVKAQNTGMGINGVMNAPNKGGILAELLVEGSTRMAFCTAHLQAHEGRDHYNNRCKMIHAILEGTGSDHSTPGVRLDASVRSHMTFFLGDLNFRTDLHFQNQNKQANHDSSHTGAASNRPAASTASSTGQHFDQISTNQDEAIEAVYFDAGVMKPNEQGAILKSEASVGSSIGNAIGASLRSAAGTILSPIQHGSNGQVEKEIHMEQVRQLVQHQEWRELNRADELFRALRDKDCLFGFQTLPCYFPPTFKVLRQKGYEYKDNRRPSYTDRVLWKTIQKCEKSIVPVAYEPIDSFSTSDHKPVRAAFEVALNEVIRPKPPRFQGRMSVSTRNLVYRSTRRAGGKHDQMLHLFFSSIKAGIRKRHSTPDPFISFITFPQGLSQDDETRWKKMKARLWLGANLSLETKSGEDGAVQRTLHGFPRTRRLKGTYHPSWRDDEISIRVRTHDSSGKPLDMTGAMLVLAVMDHQPDPRDGNVVGVFTLNLAELCMTSSVNPRMSMRKRKSKSGRGIKNMFRSTRNMGATEEHRSLNDSIDEPGVRTLNLKQPLTKAGKHAGWISCTVDAWWLDDATPRQSRQSVANHAAKVRRSISNPQHPAVLSAPLEHEESPDALRTSVNAPMIGDLAQKEVNTPKVHRDRKRQQKKTRTMKRHTMDHTAPSPVQPSDVPMRRNKSAPFATPELGSSSPVSLVRNDPTALNGPLYRISPPARNSPSRVSPTGRISPGRMSPNHQPSPPPSAAGRTPWPPGHGGGSPRRSPVLSNVSYSPDQRHSPKQSSPTTYSALRAPHSPLRNQIQLSPRDQNRRLSPSSGYAPQTGVLRASPSVPSINSNSLGVSNTGIPLSPSLGQSPRRNYSPPSGRQPSPYRHRMNLPVSLGDPQTTRAHFAEQMLGPVPGSVPQSPYTRRHRYEHKQPPQHY